MQLSLFPDPLPGPACGPRRASGTVRCLATGIRGKLAAALVLLPLASANADTAALQIPIHNAALTTSFSDPTDMRVNVPPGAPIEPRPAHRRDVDARPGPWIWHPGPMFDPGSGQPVDAPALRFHSWDGFAEFTVAAYPNVRKETLDDLFQRSKRRYTEERNARITYERKKADWFVISGFEGGRIFYERHAVSEDGDVICTFAISYPAEQKEYYDAIVTRMSRSFTVGSGDRSLNPAP